MTTIEYRIPTYRHKNEPIVLVECTRDDLEKLIELYGPEDGFTRDVRDAMRFLDGLGEPSRNELADLNSDDMRDKAE